MDTVNIDSQHMNIWYTYTWNTSTNALTEMGTVSVSKNDSNIDSKWIDILPTQRHRHAHVWI